MSADPAPGPTSRGVHRTARLSALVAGCCALLAASAGAQRTVSLTRAQAVDAAVARGARVAIATADTAAAFAQLVTARAFENPTLTAEHSKDVPQWHFLLDVPIDYPWLRRPRVGAAVAARTASLLRYASERAGAAVDADTTYTRALAAGAHLVLSRRNAAAADTLRRVAIRRREAGDAADLEVELANVNAGQQENAAAADSLTWVSTLLDLQAAIGMQASRVEVSLADTLGAPPVDSAALDESDARESVPVAAGSDSTGASASQPPPLAIAAAEASVESARLAVELQRRSAWPVPSLTGGIETGDPSGDERGVLPVIGIGLPLPLFNRNNGPIAQARADRARAEAELLAARVESRSAIAHARRALAVALERVRRDRTLVAAADRVAAMSLTAYREGASTLPNVIEAQRSARDVFATYVDDLANAWIAASTLRFLTLTPSTVSTR